MLSSYRLPEMPDTWHWSNLELCSFRKNLWNKLELLHTRQQLPFCSFITYLVLHRSSHQNVHSVAQISAGLKSSHKFLRFSGSAAQLNTLLLYRIRIGFMRAERTRSKTKNHGVVFLLNTEDYQYFFNIGACITHWADLSFWSSRRLDSTNLIPDWPSLH